MNERVYIAGTGAVGTGLALLLGNRRLVGLWNRGAKRARRAQRLLRRPVSRGELDGLEDATLVLVCVSDGAVAEVGAMLARSGRLGAGAVVAHTSGALPASVLTAPRGVARGSLHPLAACPDAESARRVLRRAVWAVEGERTAVRRLQRLARDLGGTPLRLEASAKARYHAAAVMASNLVVALVATAIGEAEAAGLRHAARPLIGLAAGALERIREGGVTGGLTGPVARGDVDTVARHLWALGHDAADIYARLSLRALDVARRRGADAAALRLLRELLETRGD